MLNYIREAIMAPTTRSSKNNNSSSQVQAAKDVERLSTSREKTAAAPMRGYKVTDNERTRKYGIGANCLDMLVAKANHKFPVSLQRKMLGKSLRCPIHIGAESSWPWQFQGHVPGSGFRVCLALSQWQQPWQPVRMPAHPGWRVGRTLVASLSLPRPKNAC